MDGLSPSSRSCNGTADGLRCRRVGVCGFDALLPTGEKRTCHQERASGVRCCRHRLVHDGTSAELVGPRLAAGHRVLRDAGCRRIASAVFTAATLITANPQGRFGLSGTTLFSYMN